MAPDTFNSTVLVLPGLGNSGEGHWQTLWERAYGFVRVQQKDWDTPVCADWIDTIDRAVAAHRAERVILVGHSLACCTIVFWAQRFKRSVKGALLVAPSDTEGEAYPPGTAGFTPMPVYKLPFPSFTITSANDMYVSPERARFFARNWGSELVDIGNAGHINVASGHGHWAEGLIWLRRLDA